MAAYNQFGQDYLSNPFGLTPEQQQQQQAKLLRGDYFGGQGSPYTEPEQGVLSPAFQGGEKITEGQLRGSDQLAIEQLRGQQAAGMESVMGARAMDPWTALAQTVGAGVTAHMGKKKGKEKASALEKTLRGQRLTEAEQERMKVFRETEQTEFERGIAERGAASKEMSALAAQTRAETAGITTPKTATPKPAEIQAVYNPNDPDKQTGQLKPINVVIDGSKMFNMDGSEIPADIAAQMIKVTPGEQGSEPPVIQPEGPTVSEKEFNYEVGKDQEKQERARLKGVYDREIQNSQLGKMFAQPKEIWTQATGLLDPMRYAAQIVPGIFREEFDYTDEKIQSQIKSMNQAQLVYAAPGIEMLGGSKPTDFDWTTVSGTVPTADDEPLVHINYIRDTLAPNMRAEARKEKMFEEGDALYESYMKMADDAEARIYPKAPTGRTDQEQADFLELELEFGVPGG